VSRPLRPRRLAAFRTVAAAGLGLAWAGSPGPSFAAPAFHDITASSGVDFVHANGATGEKNYYEVMGSGACVLDYDGDGRLDLYLVTSHGPNRLYRNLGGLRFEDVTDAAGLGDDGYGMGAVAADVDNDGDADLYVTNFGANRLYENLGDGTFRELASGAGVADSLWGCGAAFFDNDRDGLLDLYLVNYVHVAVPDTIDCFMKTGHELYCSPRAYPRAKDAFFRNLGALRFEDVTAAVRLDGYRGRGLGVVATDFDRDGWVDVYVANDLDANFLFRNRGDGTFEEIGMMIGVSHSEDGVEESGMGIAVGDYDNDGWLDLFVTNYINETNTLYHNEGTGYFFDESATSGLGPVSLPWLSWGTHFLDYDRDGWLDLLHVNGHTESEASLADPTTTWAQRDFVFRNNGDGSFVDVTAEVAPTLLEQRPARGAAFADLDDDGDIEVLVNNQNGPALLLECRGAENRHWIGFRTVGTRSNRDGVGAYVEVHAGSDRFVREVRAGGSFLSGNDPRVLVALGDRTAVDSVTVHWPSGTRTVHRSPEIDRYHRLEEE
jgi:hypothetical protein